MTSDKTVYEMRDYWIAEANARGHTIAELRQALASVLPYAAACIGIPRETWPSDSVITQAEYLLEKTRP